MSLSLLTVIREFFTRPIHPPMRIITPRGTFCAREEDHVFDNSANSIAFFDGDHFWTKCLYCDKRTILDLGGAQ